MKSHLHKHTHTHVVIVNSSCMFSPAKMFSKCYSFFFFFFFIFFLLLFVEFVGAHQKANDKKILTAKNEAEKTPSYTTYIWVYGEYFLQFFLRFDLLFALYFDDIMVRVCASIFPCNISRQSKSGWRQKQQQGK